MTWRWRIITATAALCVGIGLGWFVLSELPARRALAAIASDDESRRHDGWQWLLSQSSNSESLRIARLEDRVDDALDDLSEDGLRHAAEMLRRVGRWNWNDQPHDLILRELALTARQGSTQTLGRVESLIRSAPDDISGDALLVVCQHLLDRDATGARMLGLALACHVVTADQANRLAELELGTLPALDQQEGGNEDDGVGAADAVTIELHRLWWLARAWGSGSELDPEIAELLLSDESTPPAVLEAQLFFLVRQAPSDAGPILEWMQSISPELRDRLPMACLLRYSTDDAARRAIRRLDRAGDAAAANIVQKRSGRREQSAARRVATNEQADPSLRRLAAWRLTSVDDELLDALLELDPKDPSGAVYEPVLLAERHLTQNDASDQAEHWLRHLDDDHARAGALLAALLGEHQAVIEALTQAEPSEDLQRALAMARLMLEDSNDPVARDRVRLMMTRDSDPAALNPDVAMSLLASGDPHPLDLLTVLPADSDRFAIQRRAWLIQRFVPHWHDAMDRPIGGDPHGIRLHFDALRARLWLDRSVLNFDHEKRAFTLDDS